MLLPLIPEIPQERSYINEFRGINRHDRIGSGELHDACNMSNDEFPALVTRKKRLTNSDDYRTIGSIDAFGGHIYVIGAKDGDAGYPYMYVDGQRVGEPIVEETNSMTDIQTAINGAWILAWPFKRYFDTTDYSWHDMERHFSGDTVDFLNVDETYQEWVDPGVTRVTDGPYTKIREVFVPEGEDTNLADSSLSYYQPGDTIHIHVEVEYEMPAEHDITQTVVYDMDAVVLSRGTEIILYEDDAPDDDMPYIIVNTANLPKNARFVHGENPTYSSGYVVNFSFQITRPVPDFDYITAFGNRMYGVKYASNEDETISSAYVSSATDIFDFCTSASANVQYLGYEATVGQIGQFTGIVPFGDSVYAFKSDCVVRLDVSAGLSTRVLKTPGVAENSSKSIASFEGYLYYLGVDGVYRFNGEYAQLISDTLGEHVYKRGVGVITGNKYYLAAFDFEVRDFIDGTPRQELLVYDIRSGLWQTENADRIISMAEHDGFLYMVNRTGHVTAVVNVGNEARGATTGWGFEPDFDWWCEFGTQGYETPDEKYVSRILIRLRMEPGTVVRVYMQYDNETSWGNPVAAIEDAGIRTVVVPVIPQRCDVYRMRIEGHGACRIYGVTKTLEGGSDIQWHT